MILQNRHDQEVADVSVLVLKILSCIYRVQEKYGAYIIAAVLCGNSNQAIERFSLKTISTFGIVNDLSQRQVIAVIRYLIENGLIVRLATHKNLALTGAGRIFLKEKPEFYIPNSIFHVAPTPVFVHKLTATHMATLQFFQREKSIPAIAKIRNIIEQTVYDHLADLVYHGKITDIDDFVDKERQDDIQRVIALYSTARLKVLKEHLPDEISYAQIKLVLAMKLRQVNNGI